MQWLSLCASYLRSHGGLVKCLHTEKGETTAYFLKGKKGRHGELQAV